MHTNLHPYGQKILVSNPGKQYTHQLLHSLQKHKRPYIFITSFWYKPRRFPFNLISLFPKNLKQLAKKEFSKRYDETLDERNIIQFPWFECIREISDKLFSQRFAEKMLFYRDRIHDWFVSRRLKKYNPHIVIGYEESCLRTFREAKKLGMITVLDLAQIHYKEISAIAESHPSFGDLYKNISLRNKINRIKEEELSLSDYIICLSDFARQSLVKHGVPAEKIFVANLGFDPSKFTPKNSYSLSGKLKIVFVGTITKRKGIDMLLEIQKELSDYIELTFIGPMADAKPLFQKYKSDDKCHPPVDHTRLNTLLNQSDLFVFPSYLDSWAMVVIEAMACGLPVIVSENTGAKEAVLNGSGFVIPPGDTDILKEKVSYFYRNRKALETMGKNARISSSKYTWDIYHHRIYSIIHEIESLR